MELRQHLSAVSSHTFPGECLASAGYSDDGKLALVWVAREGTVTGFVGLLMTQSRDRNGSITEGVVPSELKLQILNASSAD